jgi:hypothetical protein
VTIDDAAQGRHACPVPFRELAFRRGERPCRFGSPPCPIRARPGGTR